MQSIRVFAALVFGVVIGWVFHSSSPPDRTPQKPSVQIVDNDYDERSAGESQTIALTDFDTEWSRKRADVWRKIANGDADHLAIEALNDDEDCEREATLRAKMGDKYGAWAVQQMVSSKDFYNSDLTPAEAAAIYTAKVRHDHALCELNRLYHAGMIDERDHDTQQTELAEEYDKAVTRTIGEVRYHSSIDVEEENDHDLNDRLALLHHFAPAWNLSDDQIKHVSELVERLENSFASDGSWKNTLQEIKAYVGDDLFDRMQLAHVIDEFIEPTEVLQPGPPIE